MPFSIELTGPKRYPFTKAAGEASLSGGKGKTWWLDQNEYRSANSITRGLVSVPEYNPTELGFVSAPLKVMVAGSKRTELVKLYA